VYGQRQGAVFSSSNCAIFSFLKKNMCDPSSCMDKDKEQYLAAPTVQAFLLKKTCVPGSTHATAK